MQKKLPFNTAEVCRCGYINRKQNYVLACPNCKRIMLWEETPGKVSDHTEINPGISQ
jgi:hypothetical protein